MTKQINFDMDGTIANFYGVENWLEYLMNNDATPYRIAKPLFNFSIFAEQLNRLQNEGYEINIISWLSKTSTKEFDEEVTKAKKEWLRKHLPTVKFDHIHIVKYGTPKYQFGDGILFDDEIGNRREWKGKAFDVNNIINVLQALR